jgi:putative ABC transport system permease protein
MRWWSELRYLVRKLNRRRAEQELEEEIRLHLEMETREKVADGLSREDAQYAARRAFGNVALATEDSREWWGFKSLDTLWQDLLYGRRMLLKQPRFTLAAILTLAVGIGANAAIFSVVDALLLKPLPYREPDQLVFVWEYLQGGKPNLASSANFLDWRNQNQVFGYIAASTGVNLNLSEVDNPQELHGLRVSANYFSLLGARTALGRTFLPEEEQPGKDRVTILSHHLWQQRFGADPGLIGQTITLNGESYEVVGVLLPNSNFDRSWFEIWIPLAFKPDQINRDVHFLYITARLKPEVTLAKARAEMDSIAREMEAQYPKSNQGWGVIVQPMREWIVGAETRRVTFILLCAVGFILLIACANVANLMLVRGAARQKEVAIRAALGAGGLRLMRQFLTESVLLSVCGGAAGLLLGLLLINLLNSLIPRGILAPENQIVLDHRVLLFTLSISLLTGMIFGAVPAWQSARPDLNGTLKESGRSTSMSPGRNRLRNLLAISEIALALILLVGPAC